MKCSLGYWQAAVGSGGRRQNPILRLVLQKEVILDKCPACKQDSFAQDGRSSGGRPCRGRV